MTLTVPLFARPFVYLRHGETDSNVRRIVAGSLDVPLTARGREQAQAAARALTGGDITAIYASPLQRARHTAETIAAALGLPVTLLDDLQERCWGVLEGQPQGQRVRGTVPEGAETYEAYAARVLRGLAAIPPRGTPLVVSHSGVYRVLCRTLAIPESREPVANATPVRFLPPSAPGAGWQIDI
ncbi:MAG: histidine phosphatase family protein [Burkholderiales bacterium]